MHTKAVCSKTTNALFSTLQKLVQQPTGTRTSAVHAVMRLSDLPESVVELITRYARGRQIAGTNKYARVCRQWRDADSSKDADPLRLHVDLRHMSAAEYSRAFSWMAMHGQQVGTLVLEASSSRSLPLDLFNRAAFPLRNLTWLEVTQRHSLVQLAPLLGQLPQLQHLGAALDMRRIMVGENSAYGRYGYNYNDWLEQPGTFLDESGQRWEALPDMQQLCPQLQQLDLTINTDGSPWCALIDERLSQLLPARLRQLSLTSDWEESVRLSASSVQHLAALQQLTLDGVMLVVPNASVLMQSMGALQQLRLLSSCSEEVMVQVAPKLTACWYEAAWGVGVLPQLVHLTLLQLSWLGEGEGGGPDMPEGIPEALLALTCLQALRLDGAMEGERLEVVLQQVAGMSTLRNLQLAGILYSGADRLTSGLQLCTQLAALLLIVLIDNRAPGEDWDFANLRFAPVPQQLTGLRRLNINDKVLEYDNGVWVTALSQLTCLWVPFWSRGPCRLVEGPLCQVRDWGAVRRQLQARCGQDEPPLASDGTACASQRTSGAHWQVTPAEPGAGAVRVFTDLSHAGSQPLVPCPHLPGVWELQGELEALGSGWSWSSESRHR